jgi:hypothetical protein
VRLFGIELGQAIRSPSFWLSMLTRTLVLFLGLSILFKWAYRAENWTFNRAAEMVFTNWSFYLLAIGFGAVGRAVDDRNLSISEIARVLTHRTLTLSRPLDLFAVIGLFLAGVGEQSYATLIALICGAIHVNRIIGCDASNELKSLPHREKKRGFATYEGDFPPQTR